MAGLLRLDMTEKLLTGTNKQKHTNNRNIGIVFALGLVKENKNNFFFSVLFHIK